MPELPEVETIKRDLQPLAGHIVVDATVVDPLIVFYPPVEEFQSQIKDRRMLRFSRRGKYLVCDLDDGKALIFHMRMTGSLLVSRDGPDVSYAKGIWIRLVLCLDDGSRLSFADRRRLGRVWLVPDKQQVIGKLGPEPLEPDFTADVLAGILAKRRVPIKALLCDQTAIAGIGNMYADEALFESRIHPLTLACDLSRKEVARLHQAIQHVLRAGIAAKGASVDTYIRPDNTPGQAQFEFKVAHRLRKPCPRCGRPIERIFVRGRGTYFCSHDQPLRKHAPRKKKPA